jgi:hypothetical protein
VIKLAERIKNENWDRLIVLDACRYDTFEKVYRDYLDGELSGGTSCCISTPGWLNGHFREGDYRDVVYISGNPHINSRKTGEGFNVKECFHKVVDVWNFGWDNKLGTVHPREINKAFMKEFRLFPNKRYVLHYLQPHAPFLSLKESQTVGITILQKMMKTPFGEMLRSFIGTNRLWAIERKLSQLKLGISKLDPYTAALRAVGEEGFRKAYEDNLRIVLEHVRMLLEEVEGNFVVVGDHGELLGEHGRFGHIYEREFLPPLTTVPWFRVRGAKAALSNI